MKKSELKEMIRQALLEDTTSLNEAFLLDSGIDDIVDALGYDDVRSFFEDNPGAVDAIMDWVESIPEFRDKVQGLNEAKKKDEEEDDEEVDIEADAELEDIPAEDPEMGMGGMEDGGDEEILNHLESALEAAKASGDEKLITQIGNTITFYTRSHIVGKANEMEEDLFETKRMKRLAGIKK